MRVNSRAFFPMKLENCKNILSTITAKQTPASHPSSEKKMRNITTTVAITFTKSGIVWAMKFSIFSTFCSIVFLMAPVDVPFR